MPELYGKRLNASMKRAKECEINQVCVVTNGSLPVVRSGTRKWMPGGGGRQERAGSGGKRRAHTGRRSSEVVFQRRGTVPASAVQTMQ